MSIEITELQIVPVKPQGGLIAFASFVVNNQFYVGSIALFAKTDGGYRLLYPTKKFKNGRDINIFHPINKEAGDVILDVVIKEYEAITKVR